MRLLSVVVDGRIVNSCLVPVAQVEGASIKTIEGVATGDQLHAVQQAFIDCGGSQCGICTPGMVMAAVDLLERNPNPTESEIRNGLAGNLCRCHWIYEDFRIGGEGVSERDLKSCSISVMNFAGWLPLLIRKTSTTRCAAEWRWRSMVDYVQPLISTY